LGFPIVINFNLDSKVYTKPREKSGRVSLVLEDIHDRQLYILIKIRTDSDINEPMASTALLTRKPHKSWSIDKDYNSKIRKDVANMLTTNLQIKIFGTRDQSYTEMLCVLVTLAMRVTGVTTPTLSKAACNTGMDHRYYNTSINP
jgi:hypothetical protein